MMMETPKTNQQKPNFSICGIISEWELEWANMGLLLIEPTDKKQLKPIMEGF